MISYLFEMAQQSLDYQRGTYALLLPSPSSDLHIINTKSRKHPHVRVRTHTHILKYTDHKAHRGKENKFKKTKKEF